MHASRPESWTSSSPASPLPVGIQEGGDTHIHTRAPSCEDAGHGGCAPRHIKPHSHTPTTKHPHNTSHTTHNGRTRSNTRTYHRRTHEERQMTMQRTQYTTTSPRGTDSQSHTQTHKIQKTRAQTHSLTHSLAHSLTDTHSRIHSLTDTHTYTHTHSLTHRHTHMTVGSPSQREKAELSCTALNQGHACATTPAHPRHPLPERPHAHAGLGTARRKPLPAERAPAALSLPHARGQKVRNS